MEILKIIGYMVLSLGVVVLLICSLVAMAANKYKDENNNGGIEL